MDLSKIVPQNTTTLEVIDPVTGQEMGVRIVLASADSRRYLEADQKVRQRRLNRLAKVPASRRAEAVSVADAEADRLEVLAAATVSWEGVEWEGKALPCTPENAVMVYGKLRWLWEQIEQAISDRALFLASSPKNSSPSPSTSSGSPGPTSEA